MTGHLDDAAFAELWANALADGTAPANHAHLETCAECRLRFTSFSHWLEGIRHDGLADAEVASADRLTAQQFQIFRRIEAAERPARVIAFPKSPADAIRPTPIRGWMVGVAAAAFVAGLGLGQLFDSPLRAPGTPAFPSDRLTDASPRPATAAPGIVPAVAVLNEEATLAELEEAATPHYEALRAYDTFTPRAADFLQPR